MRQALLRRRHYIALYRMVHSGQPGYRRGAAQSKQKSSLSCELPHDVRLWAVLVHVYVEQPGSAAL